MSNIRTFVAVEVSSDVRARARELIRKLEPAGAKISWVEPQNLHLTLKFLGDVPDNETPDVCRAVEQAVRTVAPFDLEFVSAGAFPSFAKPRTIWIGVGEGLQQIVDLQAAIDDALKKSLGFPREHRDYRPHLTIGRVREGGPTLAEVGRLLEQHSEFKSCVSYVDEVVTFASFLDKDGPTYNAMGHATLAKEE